MRAFIAIVPPPRVLEQLVELSARIRTVAPALRCEPADKLHFTLEFLGEKDESWIGACRESIAALGLRAAPFRTSIRTVGFFPGHIAPRILWAGSSPEENLPLCEFAAAVRRACETRGHAGDGKQFHPHITLSRVKTLLAAPVIARIGALTFEPMEFLCTDVCIMHSTLHRHGSAYERLATLPFHD